MHDKDLQTFAAVSEVVSDLGDADRASWNEEQDISERSAQGEVWDDAMKEAVVSLGANIPDQTTGVRQALIERLKEVRGSDIG